MIGLTVVWFRYLAPINLFLLKKNMFFVLIQFQYIIQYIVRNGYCRKQSKKHDNYKLVKRQKLV